MTVPDNIKMMMGIDVSLRSAFGGVKVFFTDTMFIVILPGKRRIECYASGKSWDALCCLTGEEYKAVPYRTIPTLAEAVNAGLKHWGENALPAS